ncbi:MAG: ribonuclease III [Thermodesulfobacteriota bacterium]
MEPYSLRGEELAGVEHALGYRFCRRELLVQALTHSSYRAEHRRAGQADNERLEFLGDAVLDTVVSALLYESYPDASEGQLTERRAQLVNTAQLARVAGQLGIDGFLLLGQGEADSGGRRKRSILGSAYEALVGAVFLDGGFAAAAATIRRHFDGLLVTGESEAPLADAKSRLQEILQARHNQTPSYVLEEASGPDHHRQFTVSVCFAGAVLGTGKGRSKKEAEKKAAAAALARYCPPQP